MVVEEKLESMLLPVIERYGCDLVLLTFRKERLGMVLRLFVEKKGDDAKRGSGVDHKLLSSISRDIDTLLEVEEIIDSKFVLEVSSPGIERPLVRLDDYRRFSGRKAKLQTSSTIDGQKKFKGVLRGVESDSVELEIKVDKKVSIPFDLIKKANLVFDIEEIGRKTGEN